MAVKVREKPKGSGVWYVFIEHNGNRKAKRIGRDKRLANEIAKKLSAKLALGDCGLIEKKAPTFGEYAATWEAVTLPATCKPSTIQDYRSILKNHVFPIFKNKPVTEIKRLIVKNYLMDKINAGFATSTVTHIKNVLGGVFNLAVDDEVLTNNPAHRLGKIFKEKSKQLDIDPFSREELSLLLETVHKYFPAQYPLLLTLARTGMRIGEVSALQWGDIDFNGRFINLRRAFSRARLETPKNGKSRKIDMSMQLAETLKALKRKRKKEKLKNGWDEVPEWLFLNDTMTGPILNQTHWQKKYYHKALGKAGLRKLRVHDLRHTYASLLIQAGESLAYIRDQLGHHSIQITVDIYGHLAPEGNKAAVDRLDDSGTATKCNLSATK